jgi:hypothetical protein
MMEGKMEGDKMDLEKIAGLTINNFNKQKNNLGGASTLMLPIGGNMTADGGDSVYSAGIQFRDAEM